MTNPMTAEEAVERLTKLRSEAEANMKYGPGYRKDAAALTLAINRLSEPSGELVEAAKEVHRACMGTKDPLGDGGTYICGMPSGVQLNRLRAAILAAEGGAK